MAEKLDWIKDGHDWPHRHASRFVQAAGLQWHVQTFAAVQPSGSGPAPLVLLIHGTGSSTHSWRGLIPLLQSRFDVLAVDLPGHGFTDMPDGHARPHQLSLPGMGAALKSLLQVLGAEPALLIGHSAGAAIAVRLCLDGLASVRMVISLNGALLPLGGWAGQLFSPLAKLMAAVPLVPKLFSWRANDPAVLKKLIDSTGSRLDETGMKLYGRLVASPGHAKGVLGMMANWDLDALGHDLPRLRTPLLLLAGSNDRTVAPMHAEQIKARLPSALRQPVIYLPGLGHLAHEEQPAAVAQVVINRFFQASPSGTEPEGGQIGA
jgi:magnesium chelatase accessory protein